MTRIKRRKAGLPPAEGLYDPQFEKDACGVGFIVNIRGERSHEIVERGLQILCNLTHRGATGADAGTGDGAGLLMQMPDKFLRRECRTLGFELPAPGAYGAGLVFLPINTLQRTQIEGRLEEVIAEEGQNFLGWRIPPQASEHIGLTAQEAEPVMRQIFIGAAAGLTREAFNRKLFVIRKRIENEVREGKLEDRNFHFHIPSLSSDVLIYKGLLLAEQVKGYFPDLQDKDMESALALVHQRYSTNTFPTWDLAQPFRYLAHNGEINTLRGNRNWMRAREALMQSELFGDDMAKILPIINLRGSDSASLDNAVELLTLAGRSLPHAMMMLVPEAWTTDDRMDEDTRAFYEYHATVQEPWDGPAALAFSDGKVIGATLDRNGLRPARYVVTKSGLVIMASEVGVLDFKPEDIALNGRLQPGRMLLIDTEKQRIIDDAEVKRELVAAHPYKAWGERNIIDLHDLPEPKKVQGPDHSTILHRQQIFGYTVEDLRLLLPPMALNAEEVVGSMGTDTPLAVLSNRPQLLYTYFKQLFAQVTNPPIDPIREEMVMALNGYIGREQNLLDLAPRDGHVVRLPYPILTNAELEKLRQIKHADFRAITLPMHFNADQGTEGLREALEYLAQKAERAVNDGYGLIVLSDRGVSQAKVPIPSLLATGAVHHHLIRVGLRTNVGIVIESGEAREVPHFALLIGYGASAINPYLAFESLADLIQEGVIDKTVVDAEKAQANYIKAIKKGLYKIFSKMGISTCQSYHGAQIFEAVGLNASLIDAYFTGTVSRISGVGLDAIAKESLDRHQRAFKVEHSSTADLDAGGEYQFRRQGEYHLWNPATLSTLQHAVQQNSRDRYREYAALINEQSKNLCTLRGLLKFKAQKSIPLDEVEPVAEIVKRFATGAMSFGSISKEAHESLAIAMNRIGGRSNTGEGGEDSERFAPMPNGDSKRSSIKQVASGRFGVTTWYMVNSDELQIKMAQGAKPGEGGQLPGHKVNEVIGKIRHSTPGVTLISPPPHHDIYSIEDLAQLIYDLKNVNPTGRVSVKLVSESGVGTVAAGVSKAKADVVLIAGHDGGTGASPMSSIKYAGTPWEIGLAETQQVLVKNDLRGRIIVQADGQMKTGRDVIIAALLGAEEFGFATAPLVTLGCIMMRKCHLNTCPVGIATQDPVLRAKFQGQPEHVINFFFFIAEEVREYMAQLGVRKLEELVGRVDMLEMNEAITHWKARGLDFSAILHKAATPKRVAIRHVHTQDHQIEEILDRQLIKDAAPAIDAKKPVTLERTIRNSNRTTGAMLSGAIAKAHGPSGLPEDCLTVNFTGTAGQSFGAFLVKGVSFNLEGDANDYVGKGLSGGRISVRVPKASTLVPEDNIIIGNTVLYGATSGEAYFNGRAGERFAVRNSGAHAVVEGVGDHGCEYMTGGHVVVIGSTGRNFAAGMSGGVAYVLDEDGKFGTRCNPGMVELEAVTPEDLVFLRSLLETHVRLTGSPKAQRMLADWAAQAGKFVKVMPTEYRKVLKQLAAIQKKGEAALAGEPA
jgi:glutamate synthase (NADPH) large chain